MKKLGFYFGLLWKVVAVAAVVILVVLCLLFYRIGTLAPGYNDNEIAQYVFTSKSTNIKAIPINSPVTVPQLVLRKAYHNKIVVLRIVTAILGFISIIGVFWVLRTWHTERVAWLAGSLYATSSWLLLTARTGDSIILLTLVPLIIICYLWLEKTQKQKLAFIVGVIVLSLLIYAPAGILVAIGVLVLRGKNIASKLKDVIPIWLFIVMGIVFTFLVSPLVISVVRNHRLLLSVVGLPQQLPVFRMYISNISDTILAISVNSNLASTAQLGNLGLIDVFTLTMIIAGFIYYIKRWRLDRSKFMLLSTTVSLILIGFGGPVSIALLLPLLFMFAGAGIAWFLQQWFAVFPRNPLAKSVGVSLIVIAVCLSVVFNLYRYYVAWPHMATTKDNYTHRL